MVNFFLKGRKNPTENITNTFLRSFLEKKWLQQAQVCDTFVNRRQLSQCGCQQKRRHYIFSRKNSVLWNNCRKINIKQSGPFLLHYSLVFLYTERVDAVRQQSSNHCRNGQLRFLNWQPPSFFVTCRFSFPCLAMFGNQQTNI